MNSVGQNALLSRAPKCPRSRVQRRPKPKNNRMAITPRGSKLRPRMRESYALKATVVTMPTPFTIDQISTQDVGANCEAAKPSATKDPQSIIMVLVTRYQDDCLTLRAIDSM